MRRAIQRVGEEPLRRGLCSTPRIEEPKGTYAGMLTFAAVVGGAYYVFNVRSRPRVDPLLEYKTRNHVLDELSVLFTHIKSKD